MYATCNTQSAHRGERRVAFGCSVWLSATTRCLPVDETNTEAYGFIDSLVYMGAPQEITQLGGWGGAARKFAYKLTSWKCYWVPIEQFCCIRGLSLLLEWLCRYLAWLDYSILETDTICPPETSVHIYDSTTLYPRRQNSRTTIVLLILLLFLACFPYFGKIN
jgi:hypothetical protein